MKTVRAKFFVQSVEHLHTGGVDPCTNITMAPVYANGDENADWSKYTPGGKLEMMVTNQSAIDQFDLGQEFYLDFTPADPAQDKG